MGLEPPTEETPTEETPAEETVEPSATEPEEVETPAEETVEEPAAEAPDQEDPLEKLRSELEAQHQQELEQQKADLQRQADERIAGMGLKNPYADNKPITTVSEYEAFRQQNQDAQWDRIAQQTGMSREELDGLIADHPEVRKALEQQAQAQAAQQEAEQRQLRQRLNEDVAAIAAECAEVTDLDSLVNHPSYPQVAAKMKAIPGLGVAEAFFLVNRAQLAAGRAAADAQRVRNNLAGKGHMKATHPKGPGDSPMSREQENMYRALLPGASRAEILEFHRQNMKGA